MKGEVIIRTIYLNTNTNPTVNIIRVTHSIVVTIQDHVFSVTNLEISNCPKLSPNLNMEYINIEYTIVLTRPEISRYLSTQGLNRYSKDFRALSIDFTNPEIIQ